MKTVREQIRDLLKEYANLVTEWDEIETRTDLSPEEKEKRRYQIRSRNTEIIKQIRTLRAQLQKEGSRLAGQAQTVGRLKAIWLLIIGFLTRPVSLKPIWMVIATIGIILWTPIKSIWGSLKFFAAKLWYYFTRPISLRTVAKMIVVIILLFSLGGYGFWSTTEIKSLRTELANVESQIKNLQAQLGKIKTDITPVTLTKVVSAPKQKVITTPQQKPVIPAKITIIRKGEGIEHSFIRQLSEAPKKFGFTGNTNDKKALKKWAKIRAHQIAILAGYVDLDGKEIRIKAANIVAYVIVIDNGKMAIKEYSAKNGTFQPTHTQHLAENYATSKLKDTIQPYEYLWPG